ncbi:MAG TPA: hypothetical protein VJ776_12020, partial [Thermoanaerobaculia bacterium]|nr:hypothetical protein [Thermoanaerobaculia bacterium]
LAFLLVESAGDPEEAIAPVARGLAAGRARLAASPAAEVVQNVLDAAPSCSVTAARWSGSLLSLCAAHAPLPFLLRGGEAVRISAAGEGPRSSAECKTSSGDLLILSSSGLARLRSGEEGRTPERFVKDLARHAAREPLESAFGRAVSDWRSAGISPGPADVVLLAARKAE